MGDFDLGRAARILALALLAVFVLDLVRVAVDMLTDEGFAGPSIGGKVQYVYSATSVARGSTVLLAVGMVAMVAAAVRSRALLVVYGIAAAVAVVMSLVGLALVWDLSDRVPSAQEWSLAESLVAGVVLGAALAIVALRLLRPEEVPPPLGLPDEVPVIEMSEEP